MITPYHCISSRPISAAILHQNNNNNSGCIPLRRRLRKTCTYFTPHPTCDGRRTPRSDWLVQDCKCVCVFCKWVSGSQYPCAVDFPESFPVGSVKSDRNRSGLWVGETICVSSEVVLWVKGEGVLVGCNHIIIIHYNYTSPYWHIILRLALSYRSWMWRILPNKNYGICIYKSFFNTAPYFCPYNKRQV